MYYELNKHKKSDSIKWIVAFSLIFVLLVGMIASLIIGVKNSQKTDEPKQEVVTENNTEPSNTENNSANVENNGFSGNSTKSTNTGYMKLAFVGSPTLTSYSAISNTEVPYTPEYIREEVESELEPEPEPYPYQYTDDDDSSTTTVSPTLTTATVYIAKTIQATVYPLTAENTKVSWSVEWATTNSTAVSSYVTVTPTTTGSTTATVKCFKPFSGEIIITCTTDDGGYMATCTVMYKGVPTDITVNGDIIQVVNNEADLGIGQTYTYTLGLTNPIGTVGSDYNQLSASITGVGTIKVGSMEHYNSSGKEYWYESSLTDISIDTIKDKFVTISLSGNVLTITTLKTIESYYESAQKIDGGRTLAYTNKYYSTVSECYFNVTITETVSGISKTFKVVLDEGVVTSVALSSTELTF